MSLRGSSMYAATFLAAIFSQVSADQPVHCLRTQIEGTWNVYVDSEQFTPDLFNMGEICQHQIPNMVQVYPPNTKFSFAKEETLLVDLKSNFDVIIEKKTQSKAWTMVYD